MRSEKKEVVKCLVERRPSSTMAGPRKPLEGKQSWDFPCAFQDHLELQLANRVHSDCVPLGENKFPVRAETLWALLGGHPSSERELGRVLVL